MKNDGPLEALRFHLIDSHNKEQNLWKTLYGKYVESKYYNVIVFSEVKGNVDGLVEYAKNNGFEMFITDSDKNGRLFRMMALFRKGNKIEQYVIDLHDVHESLYKMQKEQDQKGNKEGNSKEFTSVEIYGKEYKIDLTKISFLSPPEKRIGLSVNGMKVCQYIPPGPPSPKVKGYILTKLVFLSNEVGSGRKYFGDFNIPTDFELRDINGKSIIIDVFERMEKHETILNDRSTIRMTALDTIGRRKFLPGYALQCDNDDEYIEKMNKHESQFDRMYNVDFDVKGYYSPRIDLETFKILKDYMWNKEFIEPLTEAMNKDKDKSKDKNKKRSYENINIFWKSVSTLFIDQRISHENIVKFLFEEDHIRVEWKMICDKEK